jgi:hypothetical protein
MSKSPDKRPLKRTPDTIPNLWRYYEEHAAQARQHENLRATVTSILSGIAAAVIAIAGVGGLDDSDILAGMMVVAVGILGGALSLKHYERNRLHNRILGTIRDEITALDQDPERAPMSTDDLRDIGEREHRAKFTVVARPSSANQKVVPRKELREAVANWRSDRERSEEPKPRAVSPWIGLRLFALWLGLPIAVCVVGVLVIVLSLVGVSVS